MLITRRVATLPLRDFSLVLRREWRCYCLVRSCRLPAQYRIAAE